MQEGPLFLPFLLLFLVAAMVFYIGLHRRFPPESRLRYVENIVKFDQAGRLTSAYEADLRWFVGREKTAALIASWTERSQRIDTLEDRIVRQAWLEFQVRVNSVTGLSADARRRIKEIADLLQKCSFGAASTQLADLLKGWSEETRKQIGDKAAFDLVYGLSELHRLQHEQPAREDIRLFLPPYIHRIFWMDPKGALAEAVFWSIFGVLVNLLYNVSQAHARGRYKTEEIWISLSKIIYGPILSIVLILLIYFGWLDAGADIRFWFLPLAGFLFGYNSRKTAMVVDQFSEKLLGSLSASARQAAAQENKAVDHAVAMLQATTTPQNLAQLRQQASIMVQAATTAAVIKQQNKP